jgi:hypothetical protein
MADLPVAGQFFEDIIDGYFPLRESLHQGLARQGLGAALVVITHAPVLYIPGDDGTGPVPMRLQAATAGLLRAFLGLAVREGDGLRLTGIADWYWPVADRGLGGETRLAEPAFLRGIGLRPGPVDGGAFGNVARDDGSGLVIAGPQTPGWGFSRQVEGIERDGAALAHPGMPPTGSGPRLAVDLTDPGLARASRAMERDLTLGWPPRDQRPPSQR